MLAEYWDCNQDDLEVGIVSSIIWQISESEQEQKGQFLSGYVGQCIFIEDPDVGKSILQKPKQKQIQNQCRMPLNISTNLYQI